ncbi:MAG: DUF1249 domain-containing protein [Gammaproteobacteria bacterium]|nr:DUF1249 domain-containing protein [Gammaproteobacteria bacterium]
MLMDLYEQNYIRLRCLIPNMETTGIYISEVKGHADLFLTVKENCKYTTFLNLSYRFQNNKRLVMEPDLNIRVYHDAKTAEVQNRLNRKHQIMSSKGSIEHQWRLNRFLYKWLGYCQYQGHKLTILNTWVKNS